MSEEQASAGPSSEEGVFSLEDLDKIIEAEDPTFKEEMAGIKSTGVDTQVDIESIDVDGDGDSDGDAAPTDPNRELTRAEKFLEKINAFKTKYKTRAKEMATTLKQRGFLFVTNSKQYLRHELPDRLRYYRSKILIFVHKLMAFFREETARFKALSRIEKGSLIFVILASVFSFFFLTKVYTGAWLPRFSDPLLHSLDVEATKVTSYPNKEKMQNLFLAFPEVEIHVLLTKVIVNLRPDENSSKNPMGIYEMYLGLDSKDTAVEVKARESEIRDVIQRVLETFTYTEVSSAIGKVRMKSLVRAEVNKLLNQGQAVQVYFNTFITNP